MPLSDYQEVLDLMDMICKVMRVMGISGKKMKQKIWKMSFTVVSAMGKTSVVYPL